MKSKSIIPWAMIGAFLVGAALGMVFVLIVLHRWTAI